MLQCGVHDIHVLCVAEEWYKELPIITRCYLTAAFMSTILAHFQLLDVMLIVWDLQAVRLTLD